MAYLKEPVIEGETPAAQEAKAKLEAPQFCLLLGSLNPHS